MIQIYHNPRCTKSRQGVQLLEEKNQKFTIVKYLDNPPTPEELTTIINKLGIEAIDLVRTNEKIWKEDFKNKELSEKDIISAMIKHPKLIERPIVINDNKAVIGRPTEKILEIL